MPPKWLSPAQRIYGQWLVDGTLGAGDASAAFALAQLYIGESGLDPDPKAYLKYLKLAAKGGNEAALEALSLD